MDSYKGFVQTHGPLPAAVRCPKSRRPQQASGGNSRKRRSHLPHTWMHPWTRWSSIPRTAAMSCTPNSPISSTSGSSEAWATCIQGGSTLSSFDKDAEAVANPARFEGAKAGQSREMATRDYLLKMRRVFRGNEASGQA